MISIIGIPTDKNSSFLKGASNAPPLIMREFHSDSSNLFTESGINLKEKRLFNYNGCLELDGKKNEFDHIKGAIHKELKNNRYCISLGGDHSITFPIISAYHNFYKKLNILHFDAHPDLYQNFENNPYSHASPFARIMENNLAESLIQIGIRTMNSHQKLQAEKYNVEVVTMSKFSSNIKINFDGPIYISIDIDALDPAYAPGVSHPEPGGLSTRDILHIICSLKGKVVGGDIVEYNPNRDIHNLTAVTASKLLKELMGKILE